MFMVKKNRGPNNQHETDNHQLPNDHVDSDEERKQETKHETDSHPLPNDHVDSDEEREQGTSADGNFPVYLNKSNIGRPSTATSSMKRPIKINDCDDPGFNLKRSKMDIFSVHTEVEKIDIGSVFQSYAHLDKTIIAFEKIN